MFRTVFKDYNTKQIVDAKWTRWFMGKKEKLFVGRRIYYFQEIEKRGSLYLSYFVIWDRDGMLTV